ncbi:MAG: hypothetical protein RLZZ535_3851, partial [Cyanobacteriota bacterium]
ILILGNDTAAMNHCVRKASADSENLPILIINASINFSLALLTT